MRFLITTHAEPHFMPTTFIDPDEIVAGPAYNTVVKDGKLRFLGVEQCGVDMKNIWARIPKEQKPDVIIVHADATLGCTPVNLPDGVAHFLLVGDTHHLSRPIAGMIEYALQGKFSAIFVWNKQHAHFFKEAGFRHVFWMPGLIFGIPKVRTHEGVRDNKLAFFGQAAQYHPRSQRMLRALVNSEIPMVSKLMPRQDGLECFGRTLIAFNASLNSELNLRIFEAASMGAMILTDRLAPQAGLENFFIEGESIVTYEDEKDLLEKATYYLAHPEEAVKIGGRGKEVYDKYFTTEARRETFLDLLRGKPSMPCYTLSDEPRCRLGPAKTNDERNALGHRIVVYEWMQEMHRRFETISADVISLSSSGILSDISDLKRLTINIKSPLTSENVATDKTIGFMKIKTVSDPTPLTGATLLVAEVASLERQDVVSQISSGTYPGVFFGDITPSNRDAVTAKMNSMGMTTSGSSQTFYFRKKVEEPPADAVE